MPLKGHQRTRKQKAHVAEMGKQQWLPKSHPDEAEGTSSEAEDIIPEIIVPRDRRLFSKAEKRFRRERDENRRFRRNSMRREQHLHEKVKRLEEESQAQFEEGVKEGVRVTREGEVEGLQGKVRDLKKDLARHNARDRREPLRVDHAVRKALTSDGDPDPNLPIVRYVKDRRGIVRDWARKAILTLVNVGVPISKTWIVTKTNADALGIVIIGQWSTRTSGRVVREGGIAAGLMITGYVLMCICS
ncbi:hypothetical protein BJ322DRAFT_288556 [Thelephora terrestris]|uniref:Uncharacterized protein n=1 Tax=Thelephora terrestris TaxID=56493 RepID=A0A9P6H779_9AGAM|nr:hypothetical protein BJ322DRAFT_288556 [Thelephora terrestris]